MTTIIGDKAAVIAAIQKQVQLSSAWMDDSSLSNRWLSTTSRILERFFSDSSVAQKFVLVAREGTLAAVSYLDDLTADIQAGLFDSILPAQEIDEAHFHIIIGKILQHFNVLVQACPKEHSPKKSDLMHTITPQNMSTSLFMTKKELSPM